MGRGWLVSPRFDVGWFVLPGVAALIGAAAVAVSGDARAEDSSLSLWIVGVLLVDVAHVYASLYRTYFDRESRALHRKRLIWAPLLVAWFGFLLHLESSLLFWGALAYIAVFHFIKQHIGFALLYTRAGGEASLDRKLTTAAIWASTLGPVVYWHANLPTRFAWFVEGDLIAGLPGWIGDAALWLELPILAAFVVRRLQLARRGKTNIMVPLLVAVPALSWHMGIVWFNDDRIFTITNVFAHGIPYLALVWVTGGRRRVESFAGARGWQLTGLAVAAIFYGLLVVLAVGEEALWDRLVWHDRAELFGSSAVTLSPWLQALVVALLTVPQATHYILDRYIWRVGPDNPKLASDLGFGS